MHKFILIASILYASVWAKADQSNKELIAISNSRIQKVYYSDNIDRGTISYSYCLKRDQSEDCEIIGQELSRDLFYNFMKNKEVGRKVIKSIGITIAGVGIGVATGVASWIGYAFLRGITVGVPEIPALVGGIVGLGSGVHKAHNEAKIDDLIKQLNSKDPITIMDDEFSDYTKLLIDVLLSIDYYP
jgi:hypothetical protein